MTTETDKGTAPANDNDIFENFDALTELVQRSFTSAAKKVVAENDRLGIPTPYGRDGNIYFRQPPTNPT
ncbi:MAG: hypothetical protein HQL37_08350 [Alphaproteobacteria bacterium]|nr:hypothetical protein [Alphaproteobacteria bacterium]